MPRSGQAYPIDDALRARVERQLTTNGWTRADLARKAGCSRATITQILNGTVQQSPFVPAIHAAFGWSPPPSSLSEDDQEAMEILRELDAISRARWLERGRATAEALRKLTGEAPEKPGTPKKR